MIPLFAYGTLRDAGYQRALFGRSYPTRPATLAGRRVVIAENGYFTLIADPAAAVAGAVVELDRRALAIADRWEGASYRRRRVGAQVTGAGARVCWLYVRPSASLAAPSPEVTAVHARGDVLAAIRGLRSRRTVPARSGRPRRRTYGVPRTRSPRAT